MGKHPDKTYDELTVRATMLAVSASEAAATVQDITEALEIMSDVQNRARDRANAAKASYEGAAAASAEAWEREKGEAAKEGVGDE